MTPANLADTVLSAARAVFETRGLDPAALPATTSLERPRNPEHGDYASTLALQLGKKVGVAPRELAAALAAELGSRAGIKSVEIAGPGFLNIRLDAAVTGTIARTVVEAGPAYGRNTQLAGQRINLEFVSANPTGPIHLGHTRWAAVGDSLRRILAAAGAEVTSEYYINDAGAQVDRFARSLFAAANGQPTPEDGYVGDYITEIAQRITGADPALVGRPAEAVLPVFLERGYELMLAEIRASLERFGVHFDVWFSEKSLHDGGAVEHAIAELRKQGHIFEEGGAIWLRTTDFTDDKDRVLIRSNGEKTYFAADAAYYINKRERGFDRCVYLLGADHHGYIGRLKAIAACAGDDPDDNIEILIGQLVNLVRAGQPVRLSKRAGNIITLDELLEAVGADAARYSLARSSTDSMLTLDIEEITKHSNDNPVHYVQYAHARICSILRNADERGMSKGEGYDPALLSHERENNLLKTLGQFPAVVATAAELREPHRIAIYLEERVATDFHRFFDACQVVPKGEAPVEDVNVARRWLAEATRTVIANGLALLGVSAPERM
ncbi:arginyl-tRNA synthetase [Actinoplanes sp. SE50]|uniref:arginine--tRNA ligase n=1 Tax=unclassified Actinoplanes TaxID=2626549 RepID=UPI00023EDFDE|nr:MULTISPECIES: arginine--tRNA ligase [unclassified Actinoplanes]AEV88359.1 arginyl-tRNA synthetase [Actinoplanes sp. SE50/110]ATO86764.1 arginyl-tRNA synthetase [Actinoplanes sp. SE50]SLM04182.1 arginine--tRNA ligase [Actinoplanes sp. SE50/110]